MGPFRARHASTRQSAADAIHRRRASRAKPCPTPQPRPCGQAGAPPPPQPPPTATPRRGARCLPAALTATCLNGVTTYQHQCRLKHGRGCGVGQGLAREARRKPRRHRALPPCARVTSPERPRGLDLAAAEPGNLWNLRTGNPKNRSPTAPQTAKPPQPAPHGPRWDGRSVCPAPGCGHRRSRPKTGGAFAVPARRRCRT